MRIVFKREDGKQQTIDTGTVRRLSPSERADMVKGVEADYATIIADLKPVKRKPRKLLGSA